MGRSIINLFFHGSCIFPENRFVHQNIMQRTCMYISLYTSASKQSSFLYFVKHTNECIRKKVGKKKKCQCKNRSSAHLPAIDLPIPMCQERGWSLLFLTFMHNHSIVGVATEIEALKAANFTTL